MAVGMKTGLFLNPLVGGVRGLMPERRSGLAKRAERRLKGGSGMAGKRKKKRKARPKKRAAARPKARKRRKKRNQIPTTAKWKAKWEKGTGKKIKTVRVSPTEWKKAYKEGMAEAFKVEKLSGFRKSLLKGVAKVGTKRRKKRKKATVKARVRARPRKKAVAKRRPKSRAVAKKATPRRTKAGRFTKAAAMNRMSGFNMVRRAGMGAGLRGLGGGIHRRRYNPASPVVGTIKAWVSETALSDYAYITGGFVIGGVLPRLLTSALSKAGVAVPYGGMIPDMLIGVGASIAAGTGTALVTKDTSKGIKVAAGGLAGVVGGAIIRYLEGALPSVAGLGQNAESAIRAAVDEELRRAGLSGGMGEYLTAEMVEDAPEVAGDGGVGQFLTSEAVEEAPEVSGLDQDITEGAAAFDGFEGDNF